MCSTSSAFTHPGDAHDVHFLNPNVVAKTRLNCGPFPHLMNGMDSDHDGTKWVLVFLPEQHPPCKMITFEEWLRVMALTPTMPHHAPEAPTCKMMRQACGVTSSMCGLTRHTDTKAKSHHAKCNKARPINLMNMTQFKHLLCKQLNLKALPALHIEPSHNTCKTNDAVINAHKKKVENAVKDMIKEIVNLLSPAHHFNVGIQASKAQKVAFVVVFKTTLAKWQLLCQKTSQDSKLPLHVFFHGTEAEQP